MRTNLYVSMIVGVSILASIAKAGPEQNPKPTPATNGGATDAWRTSLPAFGKEIVAVAAKSTMTDASLGITQTREHTVFTAANGDKMWVLFKQGFDNEFHGELAKHFTGPVTWRGVVDSVRTDDKNSNQVIGIKLPAPGNLPKGMEFIETITVSVPISKLPVATLPAKGTAFAFRASLRKVKEDDVFPPVWAIYGLGPNLGKIRVGVVLADAEPIEGN